MVKNGFIVSKFSFRLLRGSIEVNAFGSYNQSDRKTDGSIPSPANFLFKNELNFYF